MKKLIIAMMLAACALPSIAALTPITITTNAAGREIYVGGLEAFRTNINEMVQIFGSETNSYGSTRALAEGAVQDDSAEWTGLLAKTDTLAAGSFSSFTNVAALHILEYPQQSNGECQGGIQTRFPDNYYFNMDSNAWLNVSHSWAAEADTNNPTSSIYYGPMKVLGVPYTSDNYQVYMGSEIGFTLAMRKILPENVEIDYTRVGWGGQPLDSFIKGTITYNHMLNRVALTKAQRPNAGIPYGIVWGQGEHGSNATNYYTMATNLIADLRADLSNSTLRVFFTGMNQDIDLGYTNEVDQAMLRIAAEDPYAYYISSKTWERNPDDTYGTVHYNSYGHLSKGAAIAAAVARSYTGIEAEENINAENLAANRATIGDLVAANANVEYLSIDGRMDANEVRVGETTITKGGLLGAVLNTAYMMPTGITLYLPMQSDGTDPVTGATAFHSNGSQYSYDSALNSSVLSGCEATKFLSLSDPLYITDQFSIAWSMRTADTDYRAMFGTSAYSGSVNGRLNSDTAINIRLYDASGDNQTCTFYLSPGYSFGDDEWHRYMITSTSPSNFWLYRDGIAQTGLRIYSLPAGTLTRSECAIKRIGNGLDNGSVVDGLTDGFMDDFTVFSKACSDEEALADYARTFYGYPVRKGYGGTDDIDVSLTQIDGEISPEGLVAYLDFDSDPVNSNLVNSAAGIDTDVPVYNAWIWAHDAERFGGTLELHSADLGYARIPDYNWATTNFTLSIWVNTTAQSGNTGIFTFKGQGYTTTTGIWDGYGGTVGDLKCIVGNNSGTAECSVSILEDLTPGEWHHVAMTVERGTNGTLKAYFDGVLAGVDTGNILTESTYNTLGLAINKWGHSADLGYANAKYDDAMAWTRVLSDDEIKALYNRQSVGKRAVSQPDFDLSDAKTYITSGGYTGTNTVLNGEGTTNTVVVIDGIITGWN